MNFNQFAKTKKTTPKRIQTIYTYLFGGLEIPGEVAELHIGKVLERVALTKETLAVACDAYKKEVVLQTQQKPAEKENGQKKTGKGSIGERLEKDRATTKKLTASRFVAIVKESNEMLASWLRYGIPQSELTSELEASLEDSEDDLNNALTGSIDTEGNYVESLPQVIGSTHSIIGWLPPSQNSDIVEYAAASN